MSATGQRIARDYRTPSDGAASLLAEYSSVPCGENDAFEARFWWLADPLWSIEGNARRDEHIARNIRRRLRDEILLRDVDSEGSGAWSHAEMIAMGPPNSWYAGYDCRDAACDQDALGAPRSADPRRIQVAFSASSPPRPYVNGGYSFAPDALRFRDPMASSPEDWAVTWGEGAESMITAETWYNVTSYQSVVLHRDGQLLGLAAAGLPLVVPTVDEVRANLAMGRPADLHVESFPAAVESPGVVRASATVSQDDWLMSLEVSGEGWRARARHGAPAPTLHGGFGLSDPVLVDAQFGTDSLPLLQAMLPTTVVKGFRPVGVYFEVYGVHEDEPLRFSVSLQSVDGEPSLLGRIARALRISGGGADAVTVEWSEAGETGEPRWMSQYMDVDFGDLREGTYDMTIHVVRSDGSEAVSGRRIEIDG